MAHMEAVAGGHPDMDYAEHERTYQRFVSLFKIGTTALVILMIGMALTLL